MSPGQPQRKHRRNLVMARQSYLSHRHATSEAGVTATCPQQRSFLEGNSPTAFFTFMRTNSCERQPICEGNNGFFDIVTMFLSELLLFKLIMLKRSWILFVAMEALLENRLPFIARVHIFCIPQNKPCPFCFFRPQIKPFKHVKVGGKLSVTQWYNTLNIIGLLTYKTHCFESIAKCTKNHILTHVTHGFGCINGFNALVGDYSTRVLMHSFHSCINTLVL